MSAWLTVIVAAGGAGERFGSPGGKQTVSVLGRPLLWWTLTALQAAPVQQMVVVCHPDRVEEYRENVIDTLQAGVSIVAIPGGDTRQDSVGRGLAAVEESAEYVAVHDGARPLVTAELLGSAVDRLSVTALDGVVVGHPCYDTLKQVDGLRVTGTPDRSGFWIAQTPQVFRRSSLVSAYEHAGLTGFVGTDDASIVEHWGGSVEMLEGPRDNIKVTTGEDLRFVEVALRDRGEVSGA